jgi:uncharacterized protein (DUF433 family)
MAARRVGRSKSAGSTNPQLATAARIERRPESVVSCEFSRASARSGAVIPRGRRHSTSRHRIEGIALPGVVVVNDRYPSPAAPNARSRLAVHGPEMDSNMGSSRVKDIYGGRHPSTIPTYTIADAARMLSLPLATVRAWVRGQTVLSKGRRRTFQRVIDADDRSRRLLSFRNVVEIHVLSAIRRAHHVSLPKVRAAVRYLADRMKLEHPLASRRLLTDGRNLLIESFGKIVNASESGQLEIPEVVARFLARIDHDARGEPIRLFPIVGDDTASRGAVVIDSRVNFGQPQLRSASISTRALADRLCADESIRDLAKDFGVSEAEIEEALRFELKRAA